MFGNIAVDMSGWSVPEINEFYREYAGKLRLVQIEQIGVNCVPRIFHFERLSDAELSGLDVPQQTPKEEFPSDAVAA